MIYLQRFYEFVNFYPKCYSKKDLRNTHFLTNPFFHKKTSKVLSKPHYGSYFHYDFVSIFAIFCNFQGFCHSFVYLIMFSSSSDTPN